MKKIMYVTLFALSAGIFSCRNQNERKEENRTLNISLEADEFEKKLGEKGVQLVDVRTPDEYAEGHLKDARNYDLSSDEFQERLAQLDKNKPVLVYCLSGGRSASAADLMVSKGFVEVYNLEGGILKWNSSHKPLVRNIGAATQAGLSMVEFNKIVKSSKLVLVDYNAKWCKPCKKMSPMLEAFAEKRKENLKLIKIDADENKALLEEKGIESIPFLELYESGTLIWRHEGLIDEGELTNEIDL